MPSLWIFGKAFHTASDDIPIFALGAATFHAFWIVAIAATSHDIMDMPQICHDKGWSYMLTVALLLACFTTGFILELLLIYVGCQGRQQIFLI